MNSELHFDTRFEIYGSTIGVRNLVCYVPLGQQFNVAIQETKKHPQPPYQASAWSYWYQVIIDNVGCAGANFSFCSDWRGLALDGGIA